MAAQQEFCINVFVPSWPCLRYMLAFAALMCNNSRIRTALCTTYHSTRQTAQTQGLGEDSFDMLTKTIAEQPSLTQYERPMYQ